jgi:hypothetical protein
MFGDRDSAEPKSRIILDRLGPQGPYDYGTARALVRLQASDKDLELWNAMDSACNEVATLLGGDEVQYLRDGVWQDQPPPFERRRDALSSTHHEGGTLWMGTDPATSVTDEWGKFHEADNLYALGPCLLPTLGSPNPMLSGVALARRTADHHFAVRPPETPPKPKEAGFRYLFDGTENTARAWQFVGQGGFVLVDEALEARPGPGLGLLYYAAEQFGDFTLRLQFRIHRPEDNSGVFVRFRDPRRPAPTPEDPTRLVPYDNNAWVASHTGFEVQIDDRALPNGADSSRTGAIYDIPLGNGKGGTQRYQNPGTLTPGDWNDLEITVAGREYRVVLNGTQTAVFERGDGPAQSWRGRSPAEDPVSGYVGLQSYNAVPENLGRVAFRNIRLKPA